MTLYNVLIELSKKHVRIVGDTYSDLLRFDLDNKTLGKIITNGQINCDKIRLKDGTTYEWDSLIEDEVEDPYIKIEELYKEYKYSIPSKMSQRSKCNFKALSVDELSMKQLVDAKERTEAQYCLEAFILLKSIKGELQWHNPNHWYWQSNNDKELFLYKKWFM